LVLPFLMVGCKGFELRRPQDEVVLKPYNHNALERFYDPMIRNAAIHDMSVADVHFVPHNPRLNELGARRLNLLAEHLETYGGTLRYETSSTDEAQIEGRIKSVKSYLTDIGADMGKVMVKPMMSGGRGMSAIDALEARQHMKDASASSSGSAGAQGAGAAGPLGGGATTAPPP